MTLFLSLLILAVAVTLLAYLKARGGVRSRAAEFPGDPGLSPLAPVSDARPHLDAIVRTGGAVDRPHLSGVWTSERGDPTRIRPKHVKGIQR